MATNSSLRNVVSDCHRLLEECCDLQALMESGWAQCRLAELKLWCDNVGVFAEHKNSLGYRLRLYPHVMEALYSSLLALLAVLDECHESGKLVSLESTSFETDCISASRKSSDDAEPDVESTDACPDDGTDDGHEWSFSSWSDQEDVEELSPYGSPDGQSRSRSVLTEHCESVGLILGQLLEIGCLIRRSGHASRLSRADASFKQSSHPHLRQHLQLLLRQRNLISFSLFPEAGRGITTQGIEQMLGCDNTHPNREREPPIDTILRVEQIQLINANLIRRHRFEFFRKRAAQLREPQTRERPVGVVMTGVQRNVTPKSNAEPRDGNLIDKFPSKSDTYIQGDSTLAASSTISVGQNSASTVDPAILLPNDGKIPQARPINYAPSTQLTQTGMKLVYPSPPPKSFPMQSTFTCPCCRELFNYPNAGSERLWRKHVKDDLYPYSCPVQGCPSSDVMFRKKTEWKFHLVKSHEIVSHWECLMCEDQDRFTEYSGFLSHLQLEHEGFVEEKHLRSVADMCSQKRLDLPVLCPVCNSPRGEADECFVDHLAECIHGFSLLALPSAMVKRTPTLTYQATDEVQQWIEATDTLANDSFQHLQLPQSAVEHYRQEGEPVVDWKRLILYSTTRATKGTPSASDHSAEAHDYFGDTRESCSSDSGDALFRFGESLNRKRGLLQRICDVDYHEQYLYLLNQHEAGSGNWFLQDITFQQWMETKDATLFCPGLPGAGKTIMTAIVVDHLLQTKHAADHPVAFVFCRTEQQHVQSMEHILASILRQVVDIQPEIPSIVQDFQESHKKEGPTFGETERALQSVLRNLRGLSIVFDALNECAPDVRHQILKTIESLRQRCDVRFMMTTRLPLDTELLSVYRSKPTLEIKAYVRVKEVPRDQLIEDLEKTIGTAREATHTMAYNSPKRVVLLNHLGDQLRARYRRTGAIADLIEAIDIVRQVVDAIPEDHPERAGNLNNLGSLLGNRYTETGAMTDLEEAIITVRQVIDATPKDHPERVERLNNLGSLLGDRYTKTGAIADLEEAVDTVRQAVDATPEDHPDRAASLNNLAIRLSDSYTRTGAMADLEEAIITLRQVVDATPKDHPERVGRLNNLGSLLGDRYTRTGAIADLEESINTLRQVVDATPQDHPDRAGRFNNLATRLGARYTRTGAMVDLEEAINTVRQAVSVTPKGHPDRAASLNNLGIRLGARYTRTGATADLEEAIKTVRQAVDATLEDHLYRAERLNNLGSLLGDRYTRTGAMVDLEEAIDTARQAVSDTPEDRPDRARHLNNLGSLLGDRYSRTGAMVDLEEAIKTARQAVDATPEDYANRARHLNNLGSRLGESYSRTGAMADLEEAIKTARQAVDATPQDHPDRAGILSTLGVRLGERYSRTGSMTDLEEASDSFLGAFNQGSASIKVRIGAARRLLSFPIIVQRLESTLDTAQAAINMLPQLTPPVLQNSDKQHLLLEAAGLASDAAAMLLFAGQSPNKAVAWLEAGRGVLAGTVQDSRTDLTNLHEKHPKLAVALIDCLTILDSPVLGGTSWSEGSSRTTTQQTIQQRQQAQQSFDEALVDIRKQSGFSRFLLPPTEAEILASSTRDPIIFINISRHRCDALAMIDGKLECIRLPTLSYQDVQERRKAVTSSSNDTLGWLWDSVVCPVLNRLDLPAATGQWSPRVWWIPTGPLVGFPLHAAGYHFEKRRRTCLDCVISTYATSLRSITYIRRQQLPQRSVRDLVLVAMENTPGQKSLANAEKEVAAVKEFSGSLQVNSQYPRRQKGEVQKALENCTIFHFAGHGSTHPSQPMRSHLLLEDHETNPLTVESLLDMKLHRLGPFLAYLSACGTSQSLDDGSLDESIHLSSACQLAGFRHVIGTLWSVDDRECVDMARSIYSNLVEQGLQDRSVSYSLHVASRALRDKWVEERMKEMSVSRNAKATKEQQSVRPLWVPYVHYGV